MADLATFLSSSGEPASIAIRKELQALSTVTTGDLLFVGQIYRARIRTRTFSGIDASGAPFTPYKDNGKKPFYFYPNKDSAGGNRQARATAAKNRHDKTGRIGVRTPLGIRYASYGAMKAALGRSNVDLYGAEQHPHMLDSIIVKAGGAESSQSEDQFSQSGSAEMAAFEQTQPATQLVLGFYGPEAERARGHNEGTRTLPKREFFALNSEDLLLGEKAISQRLQIRAKAGRSGSSGRTSISEAIPEGPITLEDVGF